MIAKDAIAVVKMAGKLLALHRQWYDVPGDAIHEAAVAAGLIEKRAMQKPCGSSCVCAEAGVEFPTECYLLTELGRQCVGVSGG